MNSYSQIYDRLRQIPIVNTHSHHLPDELIAKTDLTYLLANSYTNWTARPPKMDDPDDIRRYINKYRCNTCFRWLFDALEELYGLPVIAENFPDINRRIVDAYSDSQYHLKLLTEACRFDKIINERQPNPGSNLGHPELFFPSFRCDCYFSGYLKDKPDPNGFLARTTFENPDVKTLDEYLFEMKKAIAGKKTEGCVALKVAIAYERPLDFDRVDRAAAELALNNPNATRHEVIAFGNIIMRGICEAAAENDLPLQVHTGMGQLHDTNPMRFLTIIEENPQTKFHLLHGGFPWLDDTLALLRNYKNVWSDTAWIPYLSTRKAVDYIISALEVGDATRLTWGCDAWMSEDSLGALKAMEHALSLGLSKMVDDGAFDMDYAEYLARRILKENGRELFKLQ